MWYGKNDNDDYGVNEVHDEVEKMTIPKEYGRDSTSKTMEVMRVVRFLSYFPGDSVDGLKRKLALEKELAKVEKAIKKFYQFERQEV